MTSLLFSSIVGYYREEEGDSPRDAGMGKPEVEMPVEVCEYLSRSKRIEISVA
jgi:hypothetical protein